MILSFLLGECRFSYPESQATAFFELCRREEILIYAQQRDEKKGEMQASCHRISRKRLEASSAAAGIGLCFLWEKGCTFLVQRILNRPGLLAGLLAAFLILCLSPLFLWDVEIEGNERIATEELEKELRLAGLGKGSFLPRVDGNSVASDLRRADSRLSYVTVNLRGTVAKVQVREASEPPPTASLTPANLVAAKDGVITLPLVYEGKCLVKEGEIVRAGQMLASGILESENNGVRLTRANGQVLARTTRTYTVYVPFAYDVMVPTERQGREVALLFFGNAQKVLKTTGKTGDSCDIISTVNWWRLPGGRTLPFGFSETKSVFYTAVGATRTAEEALAQAKAEMQELIAAECGDFSLLEKTVEIGMDAQGVTLTCTVVCEENIAVTAEFTLTAE